MIPLLPDFSAAFGVQTPSQPGASVIGGGVGGGSGGLDFAGLLGAALPRAPAGLPDAAAPSAPEGPVQAEPVPSLPLGTLPELQPLLQSQPQALPQAAPLTVSNPAQDASPISPVPLLPDGMTLPPSGAIVPDAAPALPAAPVPLEHKGAPPQALSEVDPEREMRLAEDRIGAPVPPRLAARRVSDRQDVHEQAPAPETTFLTPSAALPSALPAPAQTPQVVPPPPALPPRRALTSSASSLATPTDAPLPEAVLPELSPRVPPLFAPPSETEPPLEPKALFGHVHAKASIPPPMPPVDLAQPEVAVAERSEKGAALSPLTVLSVVTSDRGTPAPASSLSFVTVKGMSPAAPSVSSAKGTPPMAAAPEPQGKPVAVDAKLPQPIAPLKSAPAPAPDSAEPAPLAQRLDPLTKAAIKVQPDAPAKGAAPAPKPLAGPSAEPAGDAVPLLTKVALSMAPNLAASPEPSAAPTSGSALVQTPASTPVPAAPVIAAVSEPIAPQETTRAVPSPQLEETITAVGELREAMRTARPEMTVRHAEFGAVSMRLEAAGAQDWRVVLASRDPGFVPAIQAALAERAVAAAAEASLGTGGGHNGSQNGSGEPRYGSSLGSGQGGSQPYSGQHTSRDEGGLAHHQQQRQQRGSGTSAAAADGGSQPGDGSPRERGLFA